MYFFQFRLVKFTIFAKPMHEIPNFFHVWSTKFMIFSRLIGNYDFFRDRLTKFEFFLRKIGEITNFSSCLRHYSQFFLAWSTFSHFFRNLIPEICNFYEANPRNSMKLLFLQAWSKKFMMFWVSIIGRHIIRSKNI